MDQKKYVSKKSRKIYAWAACGQGAIYAMVSSWILRYYTDVVGLELAFVMGLMWVARILNAFADPVVGIMVDKTQNKSGRFRPHGKMRPYLLFMPFIISLFTILLFLDFKMPMFGKCIYAAVIYILWGLAYSLGDVPFWGLPCAMTENMGERDKIFSMAKLLNSIGGAVPTVVVSLLMSESVLGLEKGITYSAFAITAIGLIPFGMTAFGTKEITHVEEIKVPMKKQLEYTFTNKILILIVLCGILSFGRYMIQAGYTYVAEYVFICNSSFINSYRQVIGYALIGIGMFPTMILAPTLIKKFSYKWLIIVSGIVSAIAMGLFYLIMILTKFNFYWAMGFLFLSGLPLGLYNIVFTSVVGECVDYLEWKKGVRLEGMTSSMSTFIAKIGAAIATGVIPMILIIAGYNADLNIQNTGTQKGLLMMITIVPATSLLLSVIPMFFYDFVGTKRQKAMEELDKKREEEMFNEKLDIDALNSNLDNISI